MSTGILKVEGLKVVGNDGKHVILRGAGLGGWMKMENFITGFPGHESTHRAAMLKVLGREKYDFFFDKWLEYFFTEADAKFFKSLGLNCIRLPFNYHHFEDDMNPYVLKIEGFKHLDRVVDICAKEGIYTILDLHSLPGGQNCGWHSDNNSTLAAFWEHKDFQDRTVWLWEQIAARYKGNPWIAGYNPINEPADPQHVRLPAYYVRLEQAIRAIDPDHILWLDGNTFASEWKGFTEVLPNCVYSIHDYSLMGFPTGQRFKDTPEQNAALERQYKRKTEFHTLYNAPVWNGEFGPVYADEQVEEEGAVINQERYKLLGRQLEIYDRYEIPWSIWLYKDVGLQGMLYVSPTSAWRKLLQPFMDKKKLLNVDHWGKYENKEIEAFMKPLTEWIDRVSPTADSTYPTIYTTRRHLDRAVFHIFLAETFQAEFAEYFKDKTKEELEELAKSFAFENCVQRDGLNKIMSEHAALVAKA